MSQKNNRPELQSLIEALIGNLTAITDDSGEYLQRLADGRVVDTKGWDGWEWTHGIALFGLFRYQQLTGSLRARELIDGWFSARFAEGTPEKTSTPLVRFNPGAVLSTDAAQRLARLSGKLGRCDISPDAAYRRGLPATRHL